MARPVPSQVKALVLIHLVLGFVRVAVHPTPALILLGAVWLVEVLWTFWDADVHSSMNRWLWALVVLLSGLLGVAIYALLGRDETGTTERVGAGVG
jgi:hypothetical protein